MTISLFIQNDRFINCKFYKYIKNQSNLHNYNNEDMDIKFLILF